MSGFAQAGIETPEEKKAKKNAEKEAEKEAKAAERAQKKEAKDAEKEVKAVAKQVEKEKRDAEKAAKAAIPKKPSAFTLFSNAERPGLKAANPDASQGDINTMVSDAYKKLGAFNAQSVCA